eukprot:5406166-Pyramimonas_sp.AAC.1
MASKYLTSDAKGYATLVKRVGMFTGHLLMATYGRGCAWTAARTCVRNSDAMSRRWRSNVKQMHGQPLCRARATDAARAESQPSLSNV